MKKEAATRVRPVLSTYELTLSGGERKGQHVQEPRNKLAGA